MKTTSWENSKICKIFIFYRYYGDVGYSNLVYWKSEVHYEQQDFFEYFFNWSFYDLERFKTYYKPAFIHCLTFKKRKIDAQNVLDVLSDFGRFLALSFENDLFGDFYDEDGIKCKITAIVSLYEYTW